MGEQGFDLVRPRQGKQSTPSTPPTIKRTSVLLVLCPRPFPASPLRAFQEPPSLPSCSLYELLEAANKSLIAGSLLIELLASHGSIDRKPEQCEEINNFKEHRPWLADGTHFKLVCLDSPINLWTDLA